MNPADYLAQVAAMDPPQLAAAARKNPDRWNVLVANVDGLAMEAVELNRLLSEAIRIVEATHALLTAGDRTTH